MDGLHVLVEKILGPDEKLRADWPVQGTTGCEFANQLGQLLLPDLFSTLPFAVLRAES